MIGAPSSDEDGMELPGLAAAHGEALFALADLDGVAAFLFVASKNEPLMRSPSTATSSQQVGPYLQRCALKQEGELAFVRMR